MSPSEGLEGLLRELAPQVLGLLVRRHGEFADAEDAVQEALLAAAVAWPRDGVPTNPYGWLVTVASRKLASIWRADAARRNREHRAILDQPLAPEVSDVDDSLLLLFLCCHPALTPASAIPLTLRAVGGMTTAEIARAFLVPEDTMAKRISRAKQRLKTSSPPYDTFDESERIQRLPSVLHVLYLMFSEGYAASSGTDVARPDLTGEAIRLARLLYTQLPGHPEAGGLLALMLLTDARRDARSGPNGELVPLSEQDRSRWDHALITEGQKLLAVVLPQRAVGYYQIQAAIAALHDEAPTADATDWPQILALYQLLERMGDNPMVTLNRAIAIAMVHGPNAGLAILDSLGGRLAGHHRLDAVKAHLLDLAGDHQAAIGQYLSAASRTTSLAERNYLQGKAARLARNSTTGDHQTTINDA